MSESKGNVLVVDDDTNNVTLLQRILCSESFTVYKAFCGKDAIEIATNKGPDLILLDVMMPNISGYEVCKILKADNKTASIPIIFLTAKIDPKDMLIGFECGAGDYITKPFDSSELISRVKTHIELKKSRDLIVKQNLEQKELLHVLCHDLVNPFGAILTIRETLDSYDTIEELKEIFIKVSDCSKDSLGLIDLVRNWRGLQEKKIPMSRCSIKKCLNRSIFILQHKVTIKNIKIRIDIDKDYNIIADQASLITVFNNLLSNAIKFSLPDSNIIIKLKNENNLINFSIEDSGIGMSKSIIDSLFKLDVATNRLGTNGEKGTGFGMPMVKKFVDLFSGNIEIYSKDSKSHKNHGTKIVLTFKAAD